MTGAPETIARAVQPVQDTIIKAREIVAPEFVKAVQPVQESFIKARDTLTMKAQDYKQVLMSGAENLRAGVKQEIEKPPMRGTIWNTGSLFLLSLVGVCVVGIATVLLFGTLTIASFWTWIGSFGVTVALGAALLFWGVLGVFGLLALPWMFGVSLFLSFPIGGMMALWSLAQCSYQRLKGYMMASAPLSPKKTQ